MSERDYDVIVYGAGPEGIAAALAAAERGGSVLLVDEGCDVGGSAVCGLLNYWQGDGNSLLMEHVRALTKRAWGKFIFEPEELAQSFRKLLATAGVSLLLGARAVKAKAKGGRIKSVSFAGHCGRVKLSAWCHVDASQDFALARLAGCCFDEEESETTIALLSRIGGIDTRVSGVFDADVLAQFTGQFKTEQAVDEIPAGIAYPTLVPCLRGGTAILNAADGGIPLGEGPLGRTAAESRCRQHVLATIGFLQRNVPGYENCYLIHFAGQPLVISRPQPLRRAECSDTEVEYGAIENLAVMNCKGPENPEVSVTVPLGNLMCRDMENLLLARAGCLESSQMPMLLACGSAAGRVAAESLLYDGDIAKLDVERLRKALVDEFSLRN